MMAKKKNSTFRALRMVFGLLVNLMIIILLLEGFTYAFHFTYQIFDDTPYKAGDSSTVTVTVLADSSSSEVIDLVYDAGVIADKYVFMAKTYLEAYYKNFQPGSYDLSPSMTNTEILMILTNQTAEE